MSSRTACAAAVVLLVSSATARVGRAQGGPTTIQLSFSNPGARSLGFGGAFVALADDATAAFANPAGLAQLTKPELSVEFRRWSYRTPFVEGGRLVGPPSGMGLDVSPGVRTNESQETLSGVSFLSFVYTGADVSLAFYRHQAANFASADETQGFFADLPDGSTHRFDDIQRMFELELVNYGLSAGFSVSESVELGFGVSFYDGALRATSDFYSPLPVTFPEGPFGPNVFAPEALREAETLTGQSASWGFNAGFLWHVNERWHVGGFYRRGASFRLEDVEISGPAAPGEPGTEIARNAATMTMPDALGLGLAYRSATGAITLSGEWDLIRYSQIINSLDPESAGTTGISVSDGHEFHLGFEYAFLTSTPVMALRIGVWRDPDHRVRSFGNGILTDTILRAGPDTVHLSGGAGVVVGPLQVDFAVDVSDIVTSSSLSAIFSF